jgi:hypothetical protein
VAKSEAGRSQETRRVWNRFYRPQCRLVSAWRKELPDGAKAYYGPNWRPSKSDQAVDAALN